MRQRAPYDSPRCLTLALLAAIGTLTACQEPGPPSLTPRRAAVSIPANWATVRSDDQGFELRAPRPLEEQPAGAPSGNGTVTRTWRGTDANGTRWVVLSFTFPAIATIGGSVLLDVVRDRAARGLDSTIVSEQRTTVQGQEARELQLRSEFGPTQGGRALVVRGRAEGRVYVLVVQPRDGQPDETDTRRYFDSFRML